MSPPESELGLGWVTEISDRTITLNFKGAGETRCYEIGDAPLQRVSFHLGQSIQIQSQDSSPIVEDTSKTVVVEHIDAQEDGTFSYRADGITFHERELYPFMRQEGPLARLKSKIFDAPHWFQQRHEALLAIHHAHSSPYRGLQGGRILLHPHQLDLAERLCHRQNIRVMLADEVGLGKTIEAGLIAHRMILTQRVQRVLILVPDTLTYQWFAELYLKFNFHSHLISDENLEDINDLEQGPLSHPYVICPLSLFEHIADIDIHWDMLIIDEVHHVEPSSTTGQQIALLSQKSEHLLLLSATPSQLDDRSHFERLRWLDLQRFSDLESYQKELQDAKKLCRLHRELKDEPSLSKELLQELSQRLKDPSINELADSMETRDALSHRLLDVHGPSYQMVRNTRQHVGGFPSRQVHPISIEGDVKRVQKEFKYEAGEEVSFRYHFEKETRALWIAEFLSQLDPAEKVLILCHNRLKVQGLSEQLDKDLKKLHSSQSRATKTSNSESEHDGDHDHPPKNSPHKPIKGARFHENMSLMERDRQAAWFNEEDGPQWIMSSPIGAEGRNFQRANHLILMDLPLHPSELEQRIGRLDRIGQEREIHIHVPLISGSPQEALFKWYHEGCDAFETTWCGDDRVQQSHGEQLMECLNTKGHPQLEELIHSSRELHTKVLRELQEGRDQLLEMGSHHPLRAQKLSKDIAREDRDLSLEHLMLDTWQLWGVDATQILARSYRLRPNESYSLPFPGFKEKGLTVTFDRSTSLKRDDATFISWDHPMVNDVLQLITQRPMGQCSALKLKAPAGIILEALFVIHHSCPKHLMADQFFPPTPLRLAIHSNGRMVKLKAQKLEQSAQALEQIPPGTDWVTWAESALEDLEKKSAEQVSDIVNDALEKAKDHFGQVIQRTESLIGLNPSIDQKELHMLQNREKQVLKGMESTHIKVDAIRLIFCTGTGQ